MTFNILVPQSFGGKDGQKALEAILKKEAGKPQSADSKSAVNQEQPETGIKYLSERLASETKAYVRMKYNQCNLLANVQLNDGGQVEGLTPFFMVAANEYLKMNGYRVANQAELESILRTGHPKWVGSYAETSLVLRHLNDDSTIASSLARQLEAENVKLADNLPCVIPLWTLNLEIDAIHSDLQFKITEDTVKYALVAPILNLPSGYFINYEVDQVTGLPNELSNLSDRPLTRKLITRDSDITRLGLTADFTIAAYNDKLTEKNFGARILIVPYSGGQSP